MPSTKEFEQYLMQIGKSGEAQRGVRTLQGMGNVATGIKGYYDKQAEQRLSQYDKFIGSGLIPKINGKDINSEQFNILSKGKEVPGLTWEKPDTSVPIVDVGYGKETPKRVEKGSIIREIKAPEIPDTSKLRPGGIDKATYDIETDLSGQFIKSIGDYPKVRDAYGRIRASAADPSPAGDLSMIFNYMKVLDPGSTVREGEFATAQNSGSLPNIVVARYNKVLNGERLAPEQRADFLDRGKRLYEVQNNQYKKAEETFRKKAKDYGVNPDRVLTNVSLADEIAPMKRPEMAGQVTNFTNEQEAMNANLPKGTEITINGRRAVIE